MPSVLFFYYLLRRLLLASNRLATCVYGKPPHSHCPLGFKLIIYLLAAVHLLWSSDDEMAVRQLRRALYVWLCFLACFLLPVFKGT